MPAIHVQLPLILIWDTREVKIVILDILQTWNWSKLWITSLQNITWQRFIPCSFPGIIKARFHREIKRLYHILFTDSWLNQGSTRQCEIQYLNKTKPIAKCIKIKSVKIIKLQQSLAKTRDSINSSTVINC